LRWQPEIYPMAKAMGGAANPRASGTVCRPVPTTGNAAASAALPQTPRSSTNPPQRPKKFGSKSLHFLFFTKNAGDR